MIEAVFKGVKLFCILIISVIAGYLLLICVYAIPTEKMEEHLQESAFVFQAEGTYPQIIKGYSDSQLDNWTDALMLLVAAHKNESPAYFSALTNVYRTVSQKNPSEAIVLVYVDQKSDNMQEFEYGRYWHGYLLWLKPLLYFMDYSSIRYINLVLQLVLFACIAALLGCRKKIMHLFPLVFAWLYINPLSTILSMQFSSVMIIIFIQILLFLLLEQRYCRNQFWLMVHFLLAGCFTAYFDLLTYPLAALVIPLLFWFSLHSGDSLRENSLFMIKHSVLWGFGYSIMWSSKWLLGSFITGHDIMGDALSQAAMRSSYTGEDAAAFSFGQMVQRLLEQSNGILAVLAVLFLAGAVIYRAGKQKLLLRADFILPCIVTGCYPFVWYAVFGNHSYWHAWFTYRELAVCVYAAGIIGMCGRDEHWKGRKQHG